MRTAVPELLKPLGEARALFVANICGKHSIEGPIQYIEWVEADC